MYFHTIAQEPNRCTTKMLSNIMIPSVKPAHFHAITALLHNFKRRGRFTNCQVLSNFYHTCKKSQLMTFQNWFRITKNYAIKMLKFAKAIKYCNFVRCWVKCLKTFCPIFNMRRVHENIL